MQVKTSSRSPVFLVFFIGTVIAGCTTGNPGEEVLDAGLARKFGVQIPQQRSAAPDFRLENLVGETVSLRDYRGDLLLLTFSTTW